MSEYESTQGDAPAPTVSDERFRDLVRSGVTRFEMPDVLIRNGVQEADAHRMVDERYDAVARELEDERWTMRSYLPVAGAGFAAAIVGGVAWGLLVSKTDYELGIVAWGIGGLAGLATLWAARGRMGLQVQLTAVVAAVLGIVLGKYLSYVDLVKDTLSTEFGPGAEDVVETFSSTTVRFFIEDLDQIVSAFDLLWVGLAVVTAWRLPMRHWAARTARSSPRAAPVAARCGSRRSARASAGRGAARRAVRRGLGSARCRRPRFRRRRM